MLVREAAALRRLWARISGSLSSKLLVVLVSSMAIVFGVLGYLNIQLHRKHLERTTLADAARVSIEDHTIGVLDGDFVFGLTLIPPSQGQDLAPVTEAQLVTIANAVLAGR